MNSTQTTWELRQQWSNPADILTILMIIGGDVVQKALAQTTGGWITPTCFSFGWVACSFSMLVNVLGDGRLLPLPDVSAKAFNLESGYRRENRSWVVGRLLRDLELRMQQNEEPQDSGLRIGVFVADPLVHRPKFRSWDRVQILWILTLFVQVVIATVPLVLYLEWGPLLCTVSGTLAVACTGMIPQWAVEKAPARRNTRKDVALTSGNGATCVVVIRGAGEAFDLEDLSAAPSPLARRTWGIKSDLLSEILEPGEKPEPRYGVLARAWYGLPAGYWITRATILTLCIFWIALLLTVAGMKTRSWYLVAVGAVGMLQNAYAASASRQPEAWGLNLRHEYTLSGQKVMDVLMDFETGFPSSGRGRALLDEFFPGELRPSEEKWWSNFDPKDYEDRRRREGRDVLQMEKQQKLASKMKMQSKFAAGFRERQTKPPGEKKDLEMIQQQGSVRPARRQSDLPDHWYAIDEKDFDVQSPPWA